MGGGRVAIVEEEAPGLPPGGLLVRAEACGLCSGELMSWYMDQKIPHVLGHEVSGEVIASEDARFPVGSRVFPHHHAPCLNCDLCRAGKYVHCPQWRRTKLVPGGMAEIFAVPADNLNDCVRTDNMRPEDAALIEPLACVWKSLDMANSGTRTAVIGLGVMGLMHALLVRTERPESTLRAFELNDARRDHARGLGIDAVHVSEAGSAQFDTVFVCPGSQRAFDFALELAAPGATVVMFAPLPPNENLLVPNRAYFQDLSIRNAYSCGPDDTARAANSIRTGALRAEQVVSDFVSLDELPAAYLRMKQGEILKAMVRFS